MDWAYVPPRYLDQRSGLREAPEGASPRELPMRHSTSLASSAVAYSSSACGPLAAAEFAAATPVLYSYPSPLSRSSSTP